MKTPKTPIEFDYDLWTTEDGKCMVRVKITGEVTEVDRKVMRILRAEEKRLRRSKQGVPISGTEGKTAEERASVLSLSYVSYEGCEDLEPLSRCAKYSASAQRPATASCGKAKSVVSKSAEPIVFRRFIFSRFSASVAEKQSRRNAWTQFVYKKCSAEVLQFEPGSGIIEARYQVGVSATKKEDNYGSRTSPRKKRILLRRVELH